MITEDMLARLKAAEEEAARLREQLQAVQGGKQAPAAAPVASPAGGAEGKAARIDGTGNREILSFPEGGVKRSSWLTEADVDFFTGGGPSELEDAAASASGGGDKDAGGTVTKRLVLGLLATAGLAAFSLVPTSSLQLRPSRPLYLYLIPMLRIQAILRDCSELIEAAEWERLRAVLSRVVGAPNDVRENLDAIVALQSDSRTAQRVEQAGLELVDFIKQCDYQNYFDAIPVRTLSAAQNLQFVDYSRRALAAAERKLKELLALMPAADLEQARQAAQI